MALTRSEPKAVKDESPPTARNLAFIIGPVLFVLAVLFPLLRQTGVRSWLTVEYEDAAIFYAPAKLHGAAAVLFRGYSGYLSLPPRVLGAIATLVPIQDLGVYFALSSAVVTALLAWFVYHYCEGWVASVPVRLALAAFVVLMPAVGPQITANITDLIWVFLIALPWALVSVHGRRRDVALRGGVVFLAATSSALSLLFVPLALGYALWRKTRATWTVVGTFGAGLLLQLLVMSHSPRNDSEPAAWRHISSIQWMFGHPSLSLLARYTGLRVFVEFVTGGKGASSDWRHGDGLLILVSTLCFVVILALLWPGAGRRTQALAATFAAYAIGMFVVTVWVSGLATSSYRYSVVPVFLLASAVAVLVAPSGAERMRSAALIGRPIFVAYVVVICIVGFPITNGLSSGPTWQATLTHTYQKECARQPGGKPVEVPTAAAVTLLFTPNYQKLVLPCRDLG